MPIRLTWSPPPFVGSGIIAYKLYKTVAPGPIGFGDFLQVFNGATFLYDDYNYSRHTLTTQGYLYALTALSIDGESDLFALPPIFVQTEFEDITGTEDWEFLFTGNEFLELFESWNIVLPSFATLQYTDDWNYGILFTPTLEYNDNWNYGALTPNLQYTDNWNYGITYTPVFEYLDNWDGAFSPTINEPWEYPPITYTPSLEYTEAWDVALLWLDPYRFPDVIWQRTKWFTASPPEDIITVPAPVFDSVFTFEGSGYLAYEGALFAVQDQMTGFLKLQAPTNTMCNIGIGYNEST